MEPERTLPQSNHHQRPSTVLQRFKHYLDGYEVILPKEIRVKKGKSRQSVELGKNLAITTDQFDLIVDDQIMESEQDRDIVIGLVDRLLAKYKIDLVEF